MNNIQNILQEIYSVDPDLKAYEKELIKIIEEIIKKRPDTKFDEVFAKELRTEVLKRARELNLSTAKIEKKSFFVMMPSWSYAVAGVVLTLLIVLPLTLNNKNYLLKDSMQQNSDLGLIKLASNSFGPLNSSNSQGADESFASDLGDNGPAGVSKIKSSGISREITEPAVRGDMVFSNTDAKESMPEPLIKSASMDSGGLISSKMIRPNPFSFKFEYVGEEFSLDQSMDIVYRRPSNVSSVQGLASLIGGLDLGLINLGALSNLGLDSLSLSQDKEYGLNFNYNAADGNFSLHKNWRQWPSPNKDCDNDQCYQDSRLRVDDVPADRTIIKIAHDFVKDLGLDVSMYGEPEVQDAGQENYESSDGKNNVWIPDELQVIYPLVLDGQFVNDRSGNPTGLVVNVDIRTRRGAGLYNLFPYNYEASDYKIVSDFARILKLAENGGERPMYYYEGGEHVNLELGTPEKVLLQYNKYDNEKGRNQVLFIPALSFPITNVVEAKYYFGQKSIMVPLVEEIVAEWEERRADNHSYPEPMPLLRGDFLPAGEPDIMEEAEAELTSIDRDE